MPGHVGRHEVPAWDRFRRTDDDAAGGGLDAHDVERPARRDSEPLPLAHGEVFDARMASEHLPALVDDLTGARATEPVRDDRRMPSGGDEADLLAVRLVGGREPQVSALGILPTGKSILRRRSGRTSKST